MSEPIPNSADDQAQRLCHKSQKSRLAHLALAGQGSAREKPASWSMWSTRSISVSLTPPGGCPILPIGN